MNPKLLRFGLMWQFFIHNNRYFICAFSLYNQWFLFLMFSFIIFPKNVLGIPSNMNLNCI